MIGAVSREILPQVMYKNTRFIQRGSLDFWNGIPFVWHPRGLLESNTGFKQLIPYLLVTNSEGSWGSYRRVGSESRIHQLCSLGIGGHIEEEDRGPSNTDTILRALHREIAEEAVRIEFSSPPQYVGLINEEETSVGKTHIGLVFWANVITLDPGPELADFQWISRESFASISFELWSRLAFQLCTE